MTVSCRQCCLTLKKLSDKLIEDNHSIQFAKGVFGVENLDKLALKKTIHDLSF